MHQLTAIIKLIILVFVGLNLMSHAASTVMDEYLDIVLCYGQSDEYSFVFHKSSSIYNRRASKLMSMVCSLFTSAYCFNWSKWFPNKPLKYPPSFDSRAILYPSDQNLKDYLSWRQADVHINNLYNTAFWNLVLNGGLTNAQAEERLRGTFSADKNELLFSEFGINYNNLPAMYRKGTILLKKRIAVPEMGDKQRLMIVPLYRDMIKEDFWEEHSELIDRKPALVYDFPNDKTDAVTENGTSENALDTKLAIDEYPELVRHQIEKLKLRRGV